MLSFKFAKAFSSKVPTHTPICIIGGGAGGISLLGHLSRQKGFLPHDIRLFDPSKVHHYQPGWTMVAGGLSAPNFFNSPMEKMIARNVAWENSKVVKIEPQNNKILTIDGNEFTYDHLILATGIRTDYDQIEGATEALEDPECPVGSIYNIKYATKMNEIAEQFTGGVAVFADPNCPIKCAGSPHKIAFLSGDRWQKKGITTAQIQIHKGLDAYFSQPHYAQHLSLLHKEKNNQVNLSSNLIKVDGKARLAYFQSTKTKEITTVNFDLLHLVPPQSPQPFLKDSGLTVSTGYVDVDPATLRHNKYPNIWALGDNANLPTSKTAAALMSQSIVLMKNLMRFIKRGESPIEAYEGYTSCPIFVGGNKLMLCEFKYGLLLDETFFRNKQHIPSKLFFLIKRHLFPWVYFYLMPRGLWLGNKGIGMAFY